ncbi:MAG: peptide chain release factor N(5)-glutamine methyltransferase [Patescibacteria group bacterium]
MTINQALKNGIKKLKTAEDGSAILDAEVLLAFILKKDKEFLYTNPTTRPRKNQLKNFYKLIARRAKNEPVAYLTSQKEFYGLDFYVNKNVLIPRPATELLVEEALNYIKKIKAKNLTICDVGAGSGAIIIALAKNIKKSLPKQNFKFMGADISRGALNVAQKNAKAHKIKINFLKSNLLKNLTDKKIDILTANLPYLKNREIRGALKYEPKRALSGGQRGAEIFKKLFRQIPDLKFPPKIIFLEIDDKQAKTLTELAKNLLPQYQRKIKKDFSGLDRLLILKI